MKITAGIVIYHTPLMAIESCLVSWSKVESPGPLEVVVLCNSPQTAYQAQLEQLVRRYPFTRWLRSNNRGFGAGHNDIMKATSCDWYICCNPDTVIHPQCLFSLVSGGENLPDSVIVAPLVLNSDGTVQKNARRYITLSGWIERQMWAMLPWARPPYEQLFDYTKVQEIEFASGCFFAIRGRHFEALGGFDEKFFLYFEDADLCLRASRLGKNYFVPGAIVVHHWEKAWTKSPRALFVQIRSLLRYLFKHGLTRSNLRHSNPESIATFIRSVGPTQTSPMTANTANVAHTQNRIEGAQTKA